MCTSSELKQVSGLKSSVIIANVQTGLQAGPLIVRRLTFVGPLLEVSIGCNAISVRLIGVLLSVRSANHSG